MAYASLLVLTTAPPRHACLKLGPATGCRAGRADVGDWRHSCCSPRRSPARWERLVQSKERGGMVEMRRGVGMSALLAALLLAGPAEVRAQGNTSSIRGTV